MGLTRQELWRELGVEFEIVAPMILDAYRREAEREWRGEEGWDATSFYVSSFPGENSCDRAAVYGLMGIPDEKPVDVTGQRWMEMGKDGEMNFVRRLAREGILLTGNEAAGEKQTKFVESQVWSSGAVDAITLPPFWRKGHVVEIKFTSAAKIAAMRADKNSTVYSHSKYERQIKAYIGYAHEFPYAPEVDVCKTSWAIMQPAFAGLFHCPVHGGFDCEAEHLELEPPDDGTLIYASRDPERGNELDVVSYYYTYDPAFLAAGRERMARWRQFFLDGQIPQQHPNHGKRALWTSGDCRYCGLKRWCKVDYAEKVTDLAASHVQELARNVRPGYDYERVRADVFKRWNETDPLLAAEVEAA